MLQQAAVKDSFDRVARPEIAFADGVEQSRNSGKDSSAERLDSPISKKDVQAALRNVELGRLSGVLPALGLFYLLYALQVSQLPAPLNQKLAGIAMVTAASCGFFAFILKRRLAGPEWAPWIGFFATATTLLNPLADLRLSGDPSATVHLLLVLLGAGFTLLSPRCFSALVVLSLGGWSLIAFPFLAARIWVWFGCVLAAGALLAVSVYSLRLLIGRRSQRKHLANKRRRREVEERRKRYELAVRGANDGLWCWDLATDRLHVTKRWKLMLGYMEKHIGEEPEEWFNLIHPYDLPALKKALTAHINGETEYFESKYRIRDREGVYRWALARAQAERDENGKVKCVAGSQTDISELIEVENRLIHDALHDKLTGLPNRSFLMRQLQTIRERKQLFAVLFLDLDRFKIINDTLGHAAGDQLLVETAERLESCKRTGDVIARLGGDEFVVVLNGLRRPEDAKTLAQRIQERLRVPVELKGQQVTSSASIGIALSEGGSSPDQLLRNADMAMYDAKVKRGNVSLFNTDMKDRVLRSWELQGELTEAIARDQFFLRYQPLVSVASRRISGTEALLRWQRPQGEILSASEIIRHAEEWGLICEIGEWVLRTACRQNKEWQQAGLPPVSVAVNVSTRQLRKGDFPALVKRVLEETGLDPKWLELELTESALMEGEDIAQASLLELSNHGIQLSLDDFGTGYSSLEYLRRFPFTTLKIAQSFVGGIPKDAKSTALLEGLIATAHKLNLKVIAEGVETEEQLAFLISEGCDWIQGFLASTPVDEEQIRELLRSKEDLLPCMKKTTAAGAGDRASEARVVPQGEGGAPGMSPSAALPLRSAGVKVAS